MSSSDLHNEDGPSEVPRRVTSLEGLLRAAEYVSPNFFFCEVLRRFGPASVQRGDVDRALFLFGRVQRAKERVYISVTSLTVTLVLPIGSFFVIDPFRWPILLTGIGLEIFLAVIFSSAHRILSQRRNDYQTWLRVVHRVARSRSSDNGPEARET